MLRACLVCGTLSAGLTRRDGDTCPRVPILRTTKPRHVRLVSMMTEQVAELIAAIKCLSDEDLRELAATAEWRTSCTACGSYVGGTS
jgi:hypothetical protein